MKDISTGSQKRKGVHLSQVKFIDLPGLPRKVVEFSLTSLGMLKKKLYVVLRDMV